MNLSRLKPVITSVTTFQQNAKKAQESRPTLEDFISARNYVGAITLLEVVTSPFLLDCFCLVHEKHKKQRI